MRRIQSSLVILVLALVGCAGDLEPTPAPAPAGSAARVPVPLTSAEVSAYRQELSQVFAKKATTTGSSPRATWKPRSRARWPQWC